MRTSAISALTCCGYAEVQTHPTSSTAPAMWALFLGQEPLGAPRLRVEPLVSLAFLSAQYLEPISTQRYPGISKN